MPLILPTPPGGGILSIMSDAPGLIPPARRVAIAAIAMCLAVPLGGCPGCVKDRCGDGRFDPGEECDPRGNYNGSCGWPYIGYIHCTDQCKWDRSGCTLCGNGMVEEGEACDGIDLGGSTCVSVDTTGGTLTCEPDCQLDLSGCTGPVCGNDVREGSEACDGADLGELTCSALGLTEGNLRCSWDCTVTEESCWRCGDAQCSWRYGEKASLCPLDCPASCGDGRCDLALGEGIQGCARECGWTDLAAGELHTCGRHADGSVSCWGSNESGQLGASGGGRSAWPVRVEGIAPTAGTAGTIAAGDAHSCAVLWDGGVLCFGANSAGELGSGPGDATWVPQGVPTLTDVVALAAGGRHTCALDRTGLASCWGENSHGQLGDGTSAVRTEPVAVPTPGPVTDLALGARHTCAILYSGAVYCWGDNSVGQLGDGTFISRGLPTEVVELTGARDVAAAAAFSCAVDGSGRVYCWGENAYHVFGCVMLGAHSTPLLNPDVPPDPLAVYAGRKNVCARSSDGMVYCWGDGTAWLIGDVPEYSICWPQPFRGSEVSIALGSGHLCTIGLGPNAECRGRNDHGQLGAGTWSDSREPLEVFTP